MPHQFMQTLTRTLGKTVRSVALLRGGGSALPGLIVERLDPDFLHRTLSDLPNGVVVITGTNGKTTTTKMVVALLESQGLTVFTNRTGSNFTRGVVAAALGATDVKGHLSADIAVLELDEAHAVKFISQVTPRHSLLLNVMRDQLDRFGEIDTTARMLASVARATTEHVVLNREDPRVRSIAAEIPDIDVSYYGLADDLLQQFPSDDDIRSTGTITKRPAASVILQSFEKNNAVFRVGKHDVTTTLKLRGIYNVYNAAAALALVKAVVGPKIDAAALMAALAIITPAFGRGESLTVNGQPLDLILVKNPSGFRLGLQSFDPAGYATMIAINDNYADGRDMSWLWDVDFESLHGGVAQLAGIRAYDMALRLQYDEVPIAHIEPDLAGGLKQFLTVNSDKPKRIYCTYTAMLALRRELAKIADVETIS